MKRTFLIASSLLASATIVTPASAQRAGENAVTAAKDAFGTSVGYETIGLYTGADARGFSPVQAGNMRIEGLYFDQQAAPNMRISGGSTLHVGISAQSYPFPAPTGIIDYRLRRPGEKQVLSAVLSYGAYDSISLELDGQMPVIAGKLSLGVGVSAARHDGDNDTKAKGWMAGTLARWRPSDAVDITAFAGRSDQEGFPQNPTIFTGGPYLPPDTYDRNEFYGQRWTEMKDSNSNFGAVGRAELGGEWTFRAGAFRSVSDVKRSFADLLLNMQPNGVADHVILANPPQRYGSYSGEARLTKVMSEGPRRHTLHTNLRGRDVKRRFGGADVRNFGTAIVATSVPLPQPVFTFGPRTDDHSRQGTVGLTYEGVWAGIGEMSVGLQKTFYEREIVQPGLAPAGTSSQPWLYNGTVSILATPELAIYASYTRGLEESGVAPTNATNRGEAMLPSLTEQVDAGIRYALTPRLKFVAGVFQVEKPYFNTNAANVFGPLGTVRHRGIETSLAGEVLDGLTVVGGVILIQARVSGEPVDRGVVGRVPLGPRPFYALFNVQYRLPWVPGLTIDGQILNTAPKYARIDNSVKVEGLTELVVGARYTFKAFGLPTTVRGSVYNAANIFAWNASATGALSPRGSRRFAGSISVDF